MIATKSGFSSCSSHYFSPSSTRPVCHSESGGCFNWKGKSSIRIETRFDGKTMSTATKSRMRHKAHKPSHQGCIEHKSKEALQSEIIDCCPICHEEERIHAISSCNHHICFKCSVRLRLLHHQFYCPICRSECPKVLMIHKLMPYDTIKSDNFLVNTKAKIWMEDMAVKEAFNYLIAHNCSVCLTAGVQQAFKTFRDLKDHIRRDHQLFFCEICVEHIKLFSSERKVYNREDLGYHKRKGDKDDTSFKGHPLCQICDHRFLDTDELWRHLRKDHFFCHFCDADGEHIYFGSYGDVKEHFRESHYLCEEDDCANIQFTNAFRSDMDLKAHKAQTHMRGAKRSQQRQARTLELEFNFGESRRNQRDTRKKRATDDLEEMAEEKPRNNSRGVSRFTQEELDTAKAIAASMSTSNSSPQLQDLIADVDSVQDFPTLSAPTVATPATAVAKPAANTAYTSRNYKHDLSESQYPSLSKPVKTSSTSTPAAAISATTAPTKAKSNPWNSADDEFPSLEGSKPRAHVHGWHLQKPEPKKQSALTFVNNQRPSMSSASDFPTLGSAAPQSLASLGSWINKDSPVVSRKTPAPYPLSTTTASTVQADMSKAGTVASTVSNSSTEGDAENSKKRKKKVSGTINSSASAKELKQIKGKAAVDKSVKASQSDNVKILETSRATGADIGQLESLSSKKKNKKSSKKLAALESQINDSSLLGQAELNSMEAANSPSSIMKAMAADKSEASKSVGVAVPVQQQLSDQDYPCLSKSSNTSVTRKPPGLTNPAAACPPPGLVSLTLRQPVPPPGLGKLSTDVLDLNSLAESITSATSQIEYESGSVSNTYMYIEPVNFTQRNRKLLFKLKELIYNDIDKFHKFKNLTHDFRSNVITAEDLYWKAKSLLGQATLMEVLPELLALLPDISKQQKLYEICAEDVRTHHSEATSWKPFNSTELMVCSLCSQVLLLIDFSHHEAMHGSGTGKPAAGDFSVKTNAKNAWYPS